ncbi:hypothetical protein RCG23_14410 [Neobacillus sp. PS3-34]|uniref:hypothetical protein n=1 Tax=Neobacillus sp. PS3-34 TaxID=3070678 RepID=UPI0027DEE5CA|nr:hypothetical protein [Neobacillus sp. PS3-34]WML46829.1 hypothetical protein RCG23_14410 [Neobacillus sp. PS3-34]
MKNKKALIGKSLMVAAVATSAFTVTNHADAASVSSAEKAVVKAEKLAVALKWEVSIENRKVKYPKNRVGYPNMKLFNDTKKALVEANKAVSTLKGKDKTVLSARLNANVSTYIKRATAYIDAVSSGLKIQKKYVELQGKASKGLVDDQTEKLYHEVSKEVKKNAFMLDRVYGVTTRNEFRSFYKQSAENLLKDLIYPVSIKMEIDRSVKDATNNTEMAAKHLGNVHYLINEAAKKGLKSNNKLIVGSQAKMNAALAEFNKQGALYVANSTSASAPTTFGPATGTETVNKTVYVYAGVNEHIKLKNFAINGNLVIVGSPAGAGSVYLENVKVNKVNSAGGNIIVQDIADHSLHMKDVEASSVIVNDADGSNIVAETGVKVGSLVISESAGAKGKISIDSEAAGSFGSIMVSSKGSSASEGVSLKGDFSTTTVTVAGENNKLSLEKDAKVNQIIINAASNISVAAGAVVNEVKKDPSVQGEVKVDNQGSIKKADSSVIVVGNPPVVVVPPVTPGPVTPPGPEIVVPSLTGFSALFASNKSVVGVNGRLDLPSTGTSPVSDSEIFTGVRFTTNPATSVKLQVTALTARNTNFLSTPLEYNISNGTTITTKDLFGALDTGTPGITMQNLRSVFLNDDITLKGKLISDNGAKSDEITIVINLGTGTPVSTFTNEFGKITKMGLVDSKHKIVVEVNPTKENTRLGDIYTAPTKIDFAQLLLAFASSSILLDSDVVPANVEELKAKIAALINSGAFNDVKLGQLKGKTFSTSKFTVEFK